MNVLVLGCGKIGQACAQEFSKCDVVDNIAVVDQSTDALSKLPNDVNAETHTEDVSSTDSIEQLLQEADCVIGATTPAHYLSLTKATINAGAHWLDFGGDETVLRKQCEYDDFAKAAGVSVVPACGVAPGLCNMLATYYSDQLDRVDRISIRVGGLPLDPQPPLNYSLEFSVKALVAEYVLPVEVIRDGSRTQVPALDGYETLSFEDKGEFEAFFTAGALATLPERFESEINELTYKTIRYSGHHEKIQFLRDLDLFQDEPIVIDGSIVSPRSVLEERLASVLPTGQPDCVIGRVTVEGQVKNRKKRYVCDLYDEFDESTGMSAMMRTTAFPAVEIGRLALTNRLDAGVTPAEGDIPVDPVLTFLNDRGIELSQREV